MERLPLGPHLDRVTRPAGCWTTRATSTAVSRPCKLGLISTPSKSELRAQIDRALAAGIDVTHLDTHMLTLFHPRLLPVYLRLGQEYRLPVFLLRWDAEQLRRWGYSLDDAEEVVQQVHAAEAAGLPTLRSRRRHAAGAARKPPGDSHGAPGPGAGRPDLLAVPSQPSTPLSCAPLPPIGGPRGRLRVVHQRCPAHGPGRHGRAGDRLAGDSGRDA